MSGEPSLRAVVFVLGLLAVFLWFSRSWSAPTDEDAAAEMYVKQFEMASGTRCVAAFIKGIGFGLSCDFQVAAPTAIEKPYRGES